MFVKVDNPKTYSGGDNKGSSYNLLSYLEKENKGKDDSEKQLFFNQTKDDLYKNQLIEALDKNHKNLGSNDSKFYSLHIDPSYYEQKKLLKHIGVDRKIGSINDLSVHEKKAFENELKEYTRGVMNLYAGNFNRGITGDDLVYGAKVEHTRKHSYNSPQLVHNKTIDKLKKDLKNADNSKQKEIKKELEKLGDYKTNSEGKRIREGMVKDGMNSHIHVVVSRNNVHQNMKLSPLAKARLNESHKVGGKEVTIGFNQEAWKMVSSEYFNEKYNYKPNEKDVYKPNTADKFRRSDKSRSIDLKTKTALRNLKHHILKGTFKNEEKILKTVLNPKKQLERELHKRTSILNIKQNLTGIVLGNVLGK